MFPFLAQMNTHQQGQNNVHSQSHSSNSMKQHHSFQKDPTPFDILLGKEKPIFNHSGNRNFRAIINTYLDKYQACPTKSSKTRLIRQVQADIQRLGYRFLKRNTGTGSWEEIKCHEAREKVSHALRDRVREQQKTTKRRRKSEQSIASATADCMIAAKEGSKYEENSLEEENVDNPITNEDNSEDESNNIWLDFEIMNTFENPSDAKSQRRFSLFSFASLNQENCERRESLMCNSEQILPKAERRLSMLGLFGTDDLTACPNTVTPPQDRRRSLFSMLDQDLCSSLTHAVRRCSLSGLFEHFTHDSHDAKKVSPNKDGSLDHAVDNDINLVEAIHDISKNIGQEMYSDPFHTMPIADVVSRSIEEAEDKLLDIAHEL
mmetsp:Transcript_6041/g.9576  ORF Transcript_6041/g.9576 Transcript_6041/m.9576 type:complete len:377 (+) Transcript_6041:59-1189(+)